MWLVFILLTKVKYGYLYKLFPIEQNIKEGVHQLLFWIERRDPY